MTDEIAYELYNGALQLYRVARYEEALSGWDEVVKRFELDPPRRYPWIALEARHAACLAANKLGRVDEAARRCGELVDHAYLGKVGCTPRPWTQT